MVLQWQMLRYQAWMIARVAKLCKLLNFGRKEKDQRKGSTKREMSTQHVSLNECYVRQKSGVLTKQVSDEMVIIDMKQK